MNRIAINWKGEIVEFMEDPMPDMWYLEGKWLPSENAGTAEFLELTRNLDIRKTIDGGSGIWVELIEEGRETIKAAVLSPPSETIFLRRDLSKKPKRKWYQFWNMY